MQNEVSAEISAEVAPHRVADYEIDPIFLNRWSMQFPAVRKSPVLLTTSTAIRRGFHLSLRGKRSKHLQRLAILFSIRFAAVVPYRSLPQL